VTGYGKYVWMADHGSIVRFTYDGVGQSFPTPTGLNAYQITRGPLGRMWFSEYGGAGVSKLASIDPQTGLIREYALPGPGGENEGETVAAGPDGKLWFGAGPGRVGSMTPSGDVVYYPTPTQDLVLWLTPGPDGNVWTVNQTPDGKASIYRITPDGMVAVFGVTGNPLVNNGAACPIQIIDSADGHLYYTDPCAMWVAQLSTSGALIQTYSSPIAPYYLTANLHAHVFFTAIPPIHTRQERGALGDIDTLTGSVKLRTAPQDGMWM